MSRRSPNFYVATDPNNNTPIGDPGAGISIGPLGTLLFNPKNEDAPPDGGTQNIAIEGALTNATINPATALATLTLTFGDGFNIADQLFITFTKAITAITFSGANIATVPALPTTITAGQQIAFVWNGTQWVRTL